MIDNKTHWYDGLFYDYVIAPNQDKSFSHIKNIIEPGSSIIDLGCGTGRLSFQISDKCSKIDGIDLSIKNIETAKRKLAKYSSENINFYHTDVDSFFKDGTHYNYGVLSYVIHEVDEKLRAGILNSLAEHVDKIIIVDYLVPRPNNFWKFINEAVEFAAGKNHYKNFKNYTENGGIKGLAHNCKLKILNEVLNSPSSSHIAILQK